MNILRTNKLEDVKKIIDDNGFSEFILNFSNASIKEPGVACSLRFKGIKTFDYPSSIMLSDGVNYFALTGIKDVSLENHVLGVLMKVTTKTGLNITIICR